MSGVSPSFSIVICTDSRAAARSDMFAFLDDGAAAFPRAHCDDPNGRYWLVNNHFHDDEAAAGCSPPAPDESAVVTGAGIEH